MKNIFLVIILLLTLNSCEEERTIEATVIDHIAATERGYLRYITIIKTDEGFIEERRGLELYTIPIGTRIYVKTFRRNVEKN